MNKKILAAAIAASIAAPMAVAADVTVYGKMHVSVDATDASANNTKVQDNWEVTSRASRLGFKGSEDLGNGMKANFQIETQVDVTDGTGIASGQRNTWMGLSGDFGEVRVGRHDTPAKVAFYASGIEMLGDSVIDANRTIDDGNNGVKMFEEVRANNAIAYISPKMSGLQFAAAMVPGEDAGTAVGDDDGIADSYSLGGWYGNGGLKLSAGYETLAGGAAPDQDMWQLGGSYGMGDFTLAAMYQDVSDYKNVRGQDKETWMVAGSFSMGNNKLIANYGNGEVTNGTTTADADTWGLALQHKMSKRTSAYAAYVDASGDETTAGVKTAKADGDSFSVGMTHSF